MCFFPFFRVGEKVHELGLACVALKLSLKHVSGGVELVASGMRYIFRVISAIESLDTGENPLEREYRLRREASLELRFKHY